MKTTILFLTAFVMTIAGFANSITINNNSSATLYYSLRGEAIFGTSNTYFESTEIEIGPGDVIHFDNPSEVPGLEYLPTTATFIFMKGYSPDCPGVDLTVACEYASASYSYPASLVNICPQTISFIVFANMGTTCNSDIIVTIL